MEHGGEDAVVLTASVSDGSLSHMGSHSGKNFLKRHEEIKSQFLGFCIKGNLLVCACMRAYVCAYIKRSIFHLARYQKN